MALLNLIVAALLSNCLAILGSILRLRADIVTLDLKNERVLVGLAQGGGTHEIHNAFSIVSSRIEPLGWGGTHTHTHAQTEVIPHVSAHVLRKGSKPRKRAEGALGPGSEALDREEAEELLNQLAPQDV